ncbi:MAG: VWA domain-containing protein [Actinomycetaceae bacterium]|nr:VWA domain-containing protein [Actinomycetaceae bacterium]
MSERVRFTHSFAVLGLILALIAWLIPGYAMADEGTPSDAPAAAGNTLQPGEVRVDKTATPVKGKLNHWEVKLRVEARDQVRDPNETTDVMLVIDTSQSMADFGRLVEAKKAAELFIEKMRELDETVRIGLSEFSSGDNDQSAAPSHVDHTDLLAALVADGGTHTQYGIHNAREQLSNAVDPAKNKHIIILSDGEPTYSYAIKNPESYLDADDHTTAAVPEGQFNYPHRVGYGTDPYTGVGCIFLYCSFYYDHANSAIAEAGFAKADGIKIWSVGIESGTFGGDVLEQIASEDSYFPTTDPTELSEIYSEIAVEIAKTITNPVVTDPIAPGFDLVDFKNSDARFEGGKFTWTPNLEEKDANGVRSAELTYTIKANDSIANIKPNEDGTYPTNGDAVLKYVNAQGKEASMTFPVPTVKVSIVKIEKELIGWSVPGTTFGVTLTDSNGFEWNFDLAAGASQTFVELGAPGEYTVTEDSAHSADYNVEYGDAGNKFTISQGVSKHVKIVNREKTGSFSIEKVVEGSAADEAGKIGFSGAFECVPVERLEGLRKPITGTWALVGPGFADLKQDGAPNASKAIDVPVGFTCTVTEDDLAVPAEGLVWGEVRFEPESVTIIEAGTDENGIGQDNLAKVINTVDKKPAPKPTEETKPQVRPKLPTTGVNGVLPMAGVGLLLLAAGSGLVVVTRRRNS